MQKNGSPQVTIETNEERNLINMFISIHEGLEETVVLNSPQSGTQDCTQGGTQGDPQDVPQGELDNWVEKQIRKNAHFI